MARKSRKNLENAQSSAVKEAVFNTAAYIRLSVEDRKQKGDSIDTQRAIIIAFIEEHPEMRLLEIYIDNGQSGQYFERPAFQRMIGDMENGRINCCITKDLSRLGRNTIDTGYYVEKFFPVKNIRYVAINDDYDSGDKQSGGIMVSLKNMINEAYALDIGRKIRAVHQMNIRNGCFVGRIPPYGYMRIREDGKNKLIPDDHAAPIVQRMFEMAAEGDSAAAILKWLNDSDFLPPSHYLHSIGQASENDVGPHAHWSFGAVSRILHNKTYCGDMVQGKTKATGHTAKKVPASEWVVVEDTHEAIISRGLFAETQRKLDKSGIPNKPRYKKPSSENIFLRKLFCGRCGFTMGRDRLGEASYRIRCNTKSMYSEKACSGISIKESRLREILFKMLREHESTLNDVLQASSSTFKSGESVDDELSIVRSELGKKQHYLKSLYESLVLGDITDDEYKEMKMVYEGNIASLMDREKLLREKAFRHAQQKNAYSETIAGIRSLKSGTDITADIIDRLVETIHIHENGSIAVQFRFMDNIVYSREGGSDE